MPELIQKIFGSAVNPIVAYVIIFIVIVLAIYIIIRIARKLLGGTYVAGGKSRHLRLAIMDATPVDSHRRLVLVRRDDVEHLILIGGPTDVVVEQNIKLAKQSTQRQEPDPMPAPLTPPTAERMEAPMMTTPNQPVSPAHADRQYTPAPITPRPMQQVAPAPIRPMAPVAPRIEPRPLAPRPLDVRPVAPPSVVAPSSVVAPPSVVSPPSVVAPTSVTVERVVTPAVPKVEMPTVAAATVATVAAATGQANPTKSSSFEDALLVDLSNDINNAANDVDDISLEDEMEGLLASLDTKGERIG